MSRLRFMFVTLFLGCCVWCHSGYAATINAASCSSASVQTAIGSSSDGDTVAVPAGACTWTAPVSYCKSITLQGAGSSSTTITVNTGSGWGNDAIFVQGCSGKQMRITGFTWQYQSADSFGILYFTGGTGLSLRLDHNTFKPNPTSPGYGRFLSFSVPAISPGVVIDHNTITDLGLIVQGSGSTAWNQAMPFETVNAVYFEDNSFGYPNFASHQVDIDCDSGAAYVFRHNSVSSNAISNHGYDSVANGCRMQNVYLNTISPNGVSNWGIQYRGGTGVVWSNTFTSHATGQDFGITNYRSNNSGQADIHLPFCSGSNAVDGNVSNGWPCYQQIGRGSGTSNGGLVSQPLYAWDNCTTSLRCLGGSNQISATVYNNFSATTDYTTQHIVQNRDFYDAQSTGCTTNQTTGVCIGLLSARATSCTTGVAYWATDQGLQGTLYQCGSGNGWNTFYSPYTYPHPLLNVSVGGAAKAAKPPTGLAVIVK